MHSYQTIVPHTSSLPEATTARTSTVHYPDGRKPCAKQITGPGYAGAHGVGELSQASKSSEGALDSCHLGS